MPERLSPREAHRKMTDEAYTYVDVRTEPEFLAGHPASAINVPVMRTGAAGLEPNPDFIEVMERVFSKDAPIIVGCKMGARSGQAAKALTAAGFTRVLDQHAGWDGTRGPFGELIEPGWMRTDLPREEGAPPGGSYAELRARLSARS